MTFDSTVTGKTVFGNKVVTWGTWDGAGATTGDIDTGLALCDFIALTHYDTAVETGVPVVNEALPVAGSAVTIIFDSGKDGYWWAFGTG
jgi:hypothetical protein